MILFDLAPTEDDPIYQSLQVSNLNRQYDFLESITEASLSANKVYISTTVLKAFNYHAIVCLHSDAGKFRSYPIQIGAGDQHQPPPHIHIQALMDDFVNTININMQSADAVVLASWALWRLNWIHPFINGNGRTARITAYYILCLKFGGLMPGTTTLPELLRRHRGKQDDPYVSALRELDKSYSNGSLDVTPLQTLISALLEEQLNEE